MHSLNDAIEIKENRITELLVSMAEMERKCMAADLRVTELNTQTEMLRLEVADTVASLAAMGSGGGGVEYNEDGEIIVLPTMLEIEQAREQLDQAQEEIVTLTERCDRLEIDLTVAQRKNVVYEQLVAVTGISNMDNAMKTSKMNSGGGNGANANAGGGNGRKGLNHDVNEIVNIIKKAIAKVCFQLLYCFVRFVLHDRDGCECNLVDSVALNSRHLVPHSCLKCFIFDAIRT